jgi:hypothetical protein
MVGFARVLIVSFTLFLVALLEYVGAWQKIPFSAPVAAAALSLLSYALLNAVVVRKGERFFKTKKGLPEPMDVERALKALDPLTPHCLWTGELGQLWGIHLQGHTSNLPTVVQGREVWVALLSGDALEIDGVVGPAAIQRGQWLRLPLGIGSGGLRAHNALVVWFTRS